MRTKLLFLTLGIFWAAGGSLRADVLEMQNGDRYSGKVLAVSANTVVLNSEILGRITVPRSKVATLTLSGNAAAPKAPENPGVPAVTNVPDAAPPALAAANTNADLSAALRQLGGNTNFIGQIRQQLLAGSPEASAKYDEMVSGLLGGQLNLADLRRQAQASAQQLRDVKRELGPEADEVLDPYLKILDAFVNETATGPGNTTATQ
ncbi:MAG: hypothetical protein ABSH48_05490 [Verrucomicrobiota bacterium]|jgi:hypothetical protein